MQSRFFQWRSGHRNDRSFKIMNRWIFVNRCHRKALFFWKEPLDYFLTVVERTNLVCEKTVYKNQKSFINYFHRTILSWNVAQVLDDWLQHRQGGGERHHLLQRREASRGSLVTSWESVSTCTWNRRDGEDPEALLRISRPLRRGQHVFKKISSVIDREGTSVR